MELNHSEPLGAPRGTVRAIIAILLTLGSIAYLILYKEIPTELITVLGMVITFYFVERTKKTTATELEEPLPKDTNINL